MSDLDIAALRDRITNYRAVKWPSMSLPIDDVQTLLDAAEERDRLATNERMMMGRISGYDECPEDPVAAVMHVADCFDHMTGIVAMVAPERDAWKHKANTLGAELNVCRGYCTPAHQLPDIETTPDAVRRNFLEWRERFALVNDGLKRLRAQRDALLAALEPIVWQLESAQRSTAPAFLKGFTMNDTESGALLRAIAAAKETP